MTVGLEVESRWCRGGGGGSTGVGGGGVRGECGGETGAVSPTRFVSVHCPFLPTRL